MSWSMWRRRHQYRAQQCHYRRRGGVPPPYLVGSRVPSQKRGPRRTVRASFPAYSSSTALSAILTPGLLLQREPFANVTLLIRLIAQAKGAEPKSDRLLTSFPSLNLKCWLATTAPRGSLHPFRSGQISNPYTTHYRSSFAFSAFSCPLPQQLPSRVTCRRLATLKQRREIGVTTFPILPARLFPDLSV